MKIKIPETIPYTMVIKLVMGAVLLLIILSFFVDFIPVLSQQKVGSKVMLLLATIIMISTVASTLKNIMIN